MKYLKLLSAFTLVLCLSHFTKAQQNPYWEIWTKKQADSLQLIWNQPINDTLRMGLARSIGWYYQEIDLDSSYYFLQQQAALAAKLKLKLWEADALDNIGYILSYKKNYAQSLRVFLTAIRITEDKASEKNIWQVSRFSKAEDPALARLVVLAASHLDIGRLYGYTGNVKEELSNSFKALKIAEQVADPANLANINMNIGAIFIRINQPDSALYFMKKSMAYSDSSGFYKFNGLVYSYFGNIHLRKRNYPLAKQYFTRAIQESEQQNNRYALALAYIEMGITFSYMKTIDSSLWYAKKGLEISQAPDLLAKAYMSLSSIFKLRNNIDSAFFYQRLAMTAKDSISSVEKLNQFQNIGFDEQLKVQELEKEKIENDNRIRIYGLLAGLAVLSVIAFIIYRNSHQRLKANKVLEQTLSNLKSTQSQLIQSEKMASLGELTAGIAHEIQNPLNFVNNFSELNQELIRDLKSEIQKGNIEEVNSIAGDIESNEEKINHHGKRAAEIVKGMLQHSRTSSGLKEPTDINALADEYLRLAYHGLRAKDKSFNATMKTDFDETIGNINIIPQDIGRVILNLITNAFYVVNEKSKQGITGYEPTVSVSTMKEGNKVLISVKDNGPGIPESIKEKIFQPFFTTKPTGQGTGLGLSLSYDIVKAHAGTIEVDSTVGSGTTFQILLPHQ